jgi:hypothetical protein
LSTWLSLVVVVVVWGMRVAAAQVALELALD